MRQIRDVKMKGVGEKGANRGKRGGLKQECKIDGMVDSGTSDFFSKPPFPPPSLPSFNSEGFIKVG